MYRFLRDSIVGRSIYRLSKHKYLRHPEEEPEYIVPSKYLGKGKKFLDCSEETRSAKNGPRTGFKYIGIYLSWYDSHPCFVSLERLNYVPDLSMLVIIL
jgi:hypothetical protein